MEVRLVNVDVAVTDPEGNFVAELKAENFRVGEDGRPQTIAHFAPTRAPVRILLLVEASPAVFLLRGQHLAAAHLLLRHLRPEDEAALASYARTVQPQADFTRDKRLVEDQLLRVSQFGLEMADLNLLDAVADTLDRLSPAPQRTAVLLIGTGLDSGSRARWQALQQRIGASQITFFTIATGSLLLGKEKDTEEASLFIEGEARLRALAEASAGQAYFPKSLKELDKVYTEIGERLRNLYSLGYYPTSTVRDGRYRTISVQLVDEAGAPLELRDRKGRPFRPRVFARPGYFAPRN
ncbi:MAG TPA: VWA domain-containing protein [Candidatus Xenobia bacterium]|nr:VWA domain-containing protein [Candidatus Xenobia bacterium]